MKRLGELTWPEARDAAKADAIVLVPVGSTEAHGPHLPLATDVILSDELAVRAAAALEARGDAVVIAPSLAYAVTDYAGPFAGTVGLSRATATAVYVEVFSSLVRQGFRRVCVVNSHLEPAHVETLRDACANVQMHTGAAVAFPDVLERRWARTLSDEFKRAECHAGQYETSLVLATRPSLVRDHVRQNLAPVRVDLARAMKDGKRDFLEAGAPDAYFGDPASATAGHGDEQYARLVEMVVDVVNETWPTATR